MSTTRAAPPLPNSVRPDPTITPQEAKTKAQLDRVLEDAAVARLAAMLFGVHSNDHAGSKPDKTPTVADIRHALRVAWKQGRASVPGQG